MFWQNIKKKGIVIYDLFKHVPQGKESIQRRRIFITKQKYALMTIETKTMNIKNILCYVLRFFFYYQRSYNFFFLDSIIIIFFLKLRENMTLLNIVLISRNFVN